MDETSIRYGGGSIDLRSLFLRLTGFLQKKRVVIVKSNPELCADILNASDTKGTFVEKMIATPAWHPVVSTESVDGQQWQDLAAHFRSIMIQLNWRERLNPLCKKYIDSLLTRVQTDLVLAVDAEEISKITLRILFELLFDFPISKADERLFYLASLEWRKEIGLKGTADSEIKQEFWQRLVELVGRSKFPLSSHFGSENDDLLVSAIAQPFIISPQINVSDIMVAAFQLMRDEGETWEKAKEWAKANNRAKLGGILLESIRLRHPFPILEREVPSGSKILGQILRVKTQYFLLLDQFEQDQKFLPERWLKKSGENPYHAIPFGLGPRMCVGKPIAMEIMTELLVSFLTEFPSDRIQPHVGHLFSGRDNDKSTGIRESFYQLKTLLGCLGQSFLLGRASRTQSTGCPWKKSLEFLRGNSAR